MKKYCERVSFATIPSTTTQPECLQCNTMSFDVVNDITQYPGYTIATITKEPQIQVFWEEIPWFSPNYWILSSRTIEKDKKEDRECKFCTFTAKSSNGLQNHIHRKHSIETPSGLECWTCGKQFSKQDLIDQHYKTVMHQINCKKLEKEEKSEMPSQIIQDIIKEYQEKRETQHKQSFNCSILEKPGTSSTQKIKRRHKTPSKYLRTEPAIIPLQSTMPQADPRSEPIISWTDVTNLDLEKSLLQTQKIPDILTSAPVKETTHKQAFREEILNLFNIPKEQIPATRSSQELLVEMPILDLTVQATSEEIPEKFSFLDYLQDQDLL